MAEKMEAMIEKAQIQLDADNHERDTAQARSQLVAHTHTQCFEQACTELRQEEQKQINTAKSHRMQLEAAQRHKTELEEQA